MIPLEIMRDFRNRHFMRTMKYPTRIPLSFEEYSNLKEHFARLLTTFPVVDTARSGEATCMGMEIYIHPDAAKAREELFT